MAVDLPEELPSSEVEKASLLEGILERGIEKLLEEVKAKKYLQEPYGRKPEPTPLMSEEQFLIDNCLEDVPENDEPQFNFEYGFNPLKFLAN